MGRGGLKRGKAGPYAIVSWTEGQTHLFLQTRTDSEQTRHRHIHPQSFPFLPTRTLSDRITQPHVLPIYPRPGPAPRTADPRTVP